jgi:hypothetical protein
MLARAIAAPNRLETSQLLQDDGETGMLALSPRNFGSRWRHCRDLEQSHYQATPRILRYSRGQAAGLWLSKVWLNGQRLGLLQTYLRLLQGDQVSKYPSLIASATSWAVRG